MITLRLAARAVQARPGRSIAAALGVLLGVAGLRAIELGTAGAFASLRAVYEAAAGPAALVAVPDGDADAPLPDGVAGRAATDPQVRAVLPLVRVTTVPVAEMGNWEGALLPGEVPGLLLLGVDRAAEAPFDRFAVVEGVRAGAGLLVAEGWARERNLRPGMRLRVWGNGATLELPIDGLIAPEGLGAQNRGHVALAPIDAVRAAFGLGRAETHEAALVLAAGARPGEVAARLGPMLGAGVQLARPEERGRDVVQRLRNVTAGTDLIQGFALGLAALLVYALFAAATAERRRELALLRCAGATRSQAARALLLEAVLVALPGAALGALLGGQVARAVAHGLGELAGTGLALGATSHWGALRAAAIGVATAVLAAALPAVRAARLDPLAALRARAVAVQPPSRALTLGGLAGSALALAGLRWFPPGEAPQAITWCFVLLLFGASAAVLPWCLPLLARAAARLPQGSATALGARAVGQRPRRAGAAAGTVLACVAMVGGISALGLGWRAELSGWASRALGWDLFVRHPAGLSRELIGRALLTPGVRRGAAVRVRRAEVIAPDGRTLDLALAGLDGAACADEETFTFAPGTRDGAALGRALERGGTAFVTGVVAAQLGVRVGDVVTARTPRGPIPLRISAEISDYTLNGYVLVVSERWMADAFSAGNADLLALRLAPGADTARVIEALEAIAGLRVETRAHLRARVLGLVDQALGGLDALLLLSALIGLLAVGSAVAQSVIERRAELAVLRALGLSRRGTVALVAAESLLTSLAGAIAGGALGLLLAWVFAESSRQMGVPVPLVLPLRALGLAVAASAVAALLAAAVPARRAAGVPPSEALRIW